MFKVIAVILLRFGVRTGTSALQPDENLMGKVGKIGTSAVDSWEFSGCKLDGVKRNNCLQTKILTILDRLTTQEIIQLPFGFKLIKDIDTFDRNSLPTYSNASDVDAARNNEIIDWKAIASYKIDNLLRTRVLRWPLKNALIQNEARRRHQQHYMMYLMFFGLMAMTVIAIPLGFQFLAVLGGKALLVAKLALILSSIQGLKKIAKSDVNYGFYNQHLSKPWLYDRRWQFGGPDHHGYGEGVAGGGGGVGGVGTAAGISVGGVGNFGGNFAGYDLSDHQHNYDTYYQQIRPRITYTADN